MNEGMTITPEGYVDEATGEFVQTGHEIKGSAFAEQQRVNEVREQAERFSTNPETGETEYQNFATHQDIDNIIDTYGGAETFNAVTDWAKQNYPPEMFQAWDDVVAKGDINEIAKAVEAIHKAYEERGDDALTTEEQTQQSEEGDITAYIFEQVMDESDYQEMVEYAAETLDEGTIEAFNEVMTNGTQEMVEETIRLLHKKLYGEN